MLTAILGALVGLVTYEIIFAINPLAPRASISWFAAFVVGVARQHALHRWLTFAYHAPYWPSLGRAYVMYSGSAVVGTGLNWVLTEELGVHHRVAWLLCLITAAATSLVFLKRFVFRSELFYG